MAHPTPYPNLQVYPTSGLNFPWCEPHPDGESSFQWELGPDGVGAGMNIMIRWQDLEQAVQRLLGYSVRVGPAPISGTVTGAASAVINHTPSIILTTADTGAMVNGCQVTITGVTGCTAANGTFTVFVIDATTFAISATCNGAYINGGTWTMSNQGGIGISRLHRALPWQHPYWNHLWVRSIVSVKGVRSEGNNLLDPEDLDDFGDMLLGGVGAGDAGVTNNGPWSVFKFAILTLKFWRPPYYVRTDDDIKVDGVQQEWKRYTDKHWVVQSQILQRRGAAFEYAYGPAVNLPIDGGAGQTVSHCKVTLKWWNIPENAIFTLLEDGTPNGLPRNLLYTQTDCVNSITSYLYPAGSPISGCVNGNTTGGTGDTDPTARFFGAYIGTLRYDSCEIHPVPLQMPPYLMGILALAGNEPMSQQQYDITFHFDLFDPPIPDAILPVPYTGAFPYKGHNCLPWSGNGQWYPVESQLGADGLPPAPGSTQLVTPFHYAVFQDLFHIL